MYTNNLAMLLIQSETMFFFSILVVKRCNFCKIQRNIYENLVFFSFNVLAIEF